MRGVRLHLSREKVTHHDPDRTPVLDDEVEHLGSVELRDVAELHLVLQRLVRAEQELLAGLAPGVEGARHLRAAEGAVVEQAAVLPGERHTLGHALVDDLEAHLREPVGVRLTRPVVAALDGVVEQPLDTVAVVLVVLRRVDATLRGDAVRAPGRVVEEERLHLVAELAERGGGRRTGESGADDDDLEASPVVGGHQLHLEAVVVPLVGERAGGCFGIEGDVGHQVCTSIVVSQWMTPARTMTGKLTLPTPIKTANAVANWRRHALNRGLFQPRL